MRLSKLDLNGLKIRHKQYYKTKVLHSVITRVSAKMEHAVHDFSDNVALLSVRWELTRGCFNRSLIKNGIFTKMKSD